MKPKPNPSQRVMTVKEVSEFLKIPPSTIYDLVKRGSIRGVKFGKHWRFLEEDILNYLKGKKVSVSNSERRRHSRMNTEIDCQILDELKRRGYAKSFGTVLNLSEGGAFYAYDDLKQTFEVGDPVQVCLKIPGLKQTGTWLEGRIVRKQDSNRLGIKFKNLSRQNREVIRDYVG